MSAFKITAVDKDHRSYVGKKEYYKKAGKHQLRFLVELGLKPHHYLLDIGCGSLRAGKHIIPYLEPKHYYCIEPNKWLVDAGMAQELNSRFARTHKPIFDYNADFRLTVFGREFDYLLAQSIFSHAAKWQIEQCLSEAFKVMNHKSIFLASFEEGGSEYTDTIWKYPGLAQYKMETMVSLAEKAKLSCKRLDFGHWDNLTWILLEKTKG